MTEQTATSREAAQQLSGSLGVASIVFMVLAGAAPLTVVGGVMPIAFSIGNGAGVPTAFVIAGLGLLLFAVGFTAMTPYVKSAGAFYSYVEAGLGVKIGAGTGYLALVSYTVLYAGVYALLGTGASALIVTFGGPESPWWLWSLVGLAIATVLGYFNIALSGRVLSVLLVAEVAIVLALDARILLGGGGPEGFSLGFLSPSVVANGALGVAVLFAVLSFIGFEATAVFRDEVKDPATTIPRATFVALISIAGFYAVTSWLLVSAVGESAIGAVGSDMLGNVAGEYLTKVGADLVAVLFVTSVFACALTFHNVVARYLHSLGMRGLAPAYFATAHPQHHSPHRAAIATGAAAFILLTGVVISGIDPITQFYTWFAGVASLGYMTLLSLTCVAVLVFFGKEAHQGLSVWKTRIAPALGLLSLLCFLGLVIGNLELLFGARLPGILAAVALVVVFLAGVAVRATHPTPADALD